MFLNNIDSIHTKMNFLIKKTMFTQICTDIDTDYINVMSKFKLDWFPTLRDTDGVI